MSFIKTDHRIKKWIETSRVVLATPKMAVNYFFKVFFLL